MSADILTGPDDANEGETICRLLVDALHERGVTGANERNTGGHVFSVSVTNGKAHPDRREYLFNGDFEVWNYGIYGEDGFDYVEGNLVDAAGHEIDTDHTAVNITRAAVAAIAVLEQDDLIKPLDPDPAPTVPWADDDDWDGPDALPVHEDQTASIVAVGMIDRLWCLRCVHNMEIVAEVDEQEGGDIDMANSMGKVAYRIGAVERALHLASCHFCKRAIAYDLVKNS